MFRDLLAASDPSDTSFRRSDSAKPLVQSDHSNQPKVRARTPSQSSPETRLAGIDLAWMGEKNGSGIAIGSLSNNVLRVEAIHCGVIGLYSVNDILSSCQALSGIGIDAPLIITNTHGARPCEKELSTVYNARWAGCYPSNLTRFPDASSVKLASWLSKHGFSHLAEGSGDRWQIECYPHPAIIELFGLDKRLRYKKGSPDEKRQGQAALAGHIRNLASRPALALEIPDAFNHHLDPQYIESLRGQRLKDNEDALDSLICLYVAGLFATGFEMTTFGDMETGYIVVPKPLRSA